MTVYFPPIEDDSQPANITQSPNENSDADQQSDDGAREQALDLESDSIAMLALLLLLNIGVVAAIIVVRSRSRQTQDNRQRAMAEFEKSLFDESGPVASPPSFEPNELPSMEPGVETQEVSSFVESESTHNDLPNFGDLLEEMWLNFDCTFTENSQDNHTRDYQSNSDETGSINFLIKEENWDQGDCRHTNTWPNRICDTNWDTVQRHR